MRVLAIQIREGGSGRLYGSEYSLLELGNALSSKGVESSTVETFPTITQTRYTGFRTFQVETSKFLPFRLQRFDKYYLDHQYPRLRYYLRARKLLVGNDIRRLLCKCDNTKETIRRRA